MRHMTKSVMKILSMILAVVMLFGAFPATAFASIDDPLSGLTGSGWNEFRGDPASEADTDSSIPDSGTDSSDTDPVSSPSVSGIIDVEEIDNTNEGSGSGVYAASADAAIPLGVSGTPEIEFEWAVNFQQWVAVNSRLKSGSITTRPLTWPGESIWLGYDTNPANSRYIGSGTLYRITYDGKDAFCGEFNGATAGGNYDDGASGSSSAIKQVLANYDATNKQDADYIAAQVKIWSILVGQPIYSWGGSGANTSVATGNADFSKIAYKIHQNLSTPHTQNIITYSNDEDIPWIPGEEEEGWTIETETEQHTETEVFNEKTYEYSDSIGQITIRKHDQDNNSLDGAIFKIRVDFTNGDFVEVENWEVDNGARLFTWTHPQDNYDPATVTAWETSPPRYYEGDPTPKTAVVHPTYTRVTHVETWTVTVTVETTTTTVTNIETGEVTISEGATAVDSVTSEPQVEEFADFVEGDRETTVTFVNRRITGEIIVTKRDANTGQSLAGAHIHLWGEDLGDPNHIDKTLVTGANGEAVFEHLPPGTYAIQETQPPFGYNLNDEIQNAVIQSGQVIRKEVRNYRKDGLIIKKVDPDGKPIAGAVFELRRGSGEVLLSEVTNENGIIFRDYLTEGLYVIEEKKAPEGYLLDQTPIKEIFIYETDDNKEYTVTFVNKKKPAIEITKVDGTTPTLKLAGAVFRITDTRTNQYWDITTGTDGTALLEGLEINTAYIVEELEAPEGYVNSGYRQEIVLKESRTHTLTIANEQKPSLKIIKKDADTGALLGGATFRLAWNGSANYQDITTETNGEARAAGIAPGTYTLKEIKAPNGYLIDSAERTVIIKAGESTVIEITDYLKPSLKIIKKDKENGSVLGGATFRVSWSNGADYCDIITKSDGTAVLTDLIDGWYTVTEINAPEGYLLDATPQQILLKPGEAAVIEIFNEAKPSLTLLKVDNVTKTPLQYARFKIEKKTDSGTALIGEYVSDADGIVYLDNIQPGRYLITEIQAPDGYNIDLESREVTIEYGKAYKLEITNTPKSPIYIQKVDDKGNPLIGAKFKVTTMNGAMVGTVTTGRTGYAIIPYAEPSWYVVEEIQAPDGYILSSTPVNVEVKSGRPAQVEFVNYKRPTLQILKLDADTQKALVGAKFKVTEVSGKLVGEYTTDVNGLVTMEGLAPGAYIIAEIKAPDGYILDMTPKTVTLEPGKSLSVEFYDVSKPGLQLLKLDKLTGLPVKGAMFSVVELQGGAKKDHGTFTTGENGTFFIPDLTPGNYVITETKAAEGYILDSTPRNIYIEGGKLNAVEFYNTPYGDLRLVKIDSETRAPLENAVFKLFNEKRLEIGTYTTSALGEIIVNQLPGGTYFVQEVKAPAGYVLDSTVRQIELIGGKTVVLEVKNTALGSLRIIKKDSITGKPLYGAAFLLYDSKDNLLGEFITDQDGGISFGRNLQASKYKIKEIRAPEGYVLDETVRTVTVKEGETTELVVPNEPIRGRIQIVKKAAEYNDITKDKEGALLKNAVFEISNSKHEVVDRITTDKRGVATTKDLPLGIYAVREITAPKHYILDDKVFYAEIKKHDDLVQFEVLNKPADISVTVQKYGNYEALLGQNIQYDFKDIANTSSVELDDFYFHDQIPTDAVRLVSISTGTYNERLTYKVMYATNLRKEYRVLQDKLGTQTVNEIDCRRETIGLKNGEYITDIKFEFGTVQPGFKEVTQPYISCSVNGDLPNEYRFTNRCDVGGQSEGELTVAKDAWVTIVYAKTNGKGKLPKTGF